MEGQIDVTLKRTEKIMTKTASLVLQIAQNEEFEGVPRNVYRFLISDGTAACPYWWYYSATQQWYQYTGEFRQDKYRKLLELYHGIAESNPTLYASMVEQYGENIDNDYYTGLNGQQLRMSMGFMVNRQNPTRWPGSATCSARCSTTIRPITPTWSIIRPRKRQRNDRRLERPGK